MIGETRKLEGDDFDVLGVLGEMKLTGIGDVLGEMLGGNRADFLICSGGNN
jgi:hypothetical protein